MNFYGFQKMTLLDYPGKVACTLFTGGCNFRCPFCHNALLVTELDDSEIYNDQEILSYLSKRKGVLDGVAITGGEPLLQEGLRPFLAEVKNMGFSVKLDTNGSFPDRLRELAEAGLLDYVAMDIKNCPEKYEQTVGLLRMDLSRVEESIAFLLSDRVDYEFRTTVVSEFHTVEDIRKAAAWIRGAKRYFLQGFTDSGNLIGAGMHPVPKDGMEEMRAAAAAFVPATALRGV